MTHFRLWQGYIFLLWSRSRSPSSNPLQISLTSHDISEFHLVFSAIDYVCYFVALSTHRNDGSLLVTSFSPVTISLYHYISHVNISHVNIIILTPLQHL